MAIFDGAESVLQQLGLERDAVQGQADFYLAYARELEDARRSAHLDVWSALANPDPDWIGLATIASTYRLAAQFLALLDPRQAALAAIRASMAYLDANMPFGAMLAFGLMDDRLLRSRGGVRRIVRRVTDMLRQPPTDDPVQQTYLLLAVVARPWLRDEFRQPILALQQALAPHELHPIGAQGRPLATYLQLANALATTEGPMLVSVQGDVQAERYMSPQQFELSIDTIASIGRLHAADLRAAQRNTYLWRHAAAPLDVVDLEGAALFGVLMRSGVIPDESAYGQIAERMSDGDPLTQVPLWAADQLYRDIQDMPDQAEKLLFGNRNGHSESDNY